MEVRSTKGARLTEVVEERLVERLETELLDVNSLGRELLRDNSGEDAVLEIEVGDGEFLSNENKGEGWSARMPEQREQREESLLTIRLSILSLRFLAPPNLLRWTTRMSGTFQISSFLVAARWALHCKRSKRERGRRLRVFSSSSTFSAPFTKVPGTHV